MGSVRKNANYTNLSFSSDVPIPQQSLQSGAFAKLVDGPESSFNRQIQVNHPFQNEPQTTKSAFQRKSIARHSSLNSSVNSSVDMTKRNL